MSPAPSTESISQPLLLPGAQVSMAGVRYCVWAPDHRAIAVQVNRADGSDVRLELAAQGDGYFVATDESGRAGDRYGFTLDGGDVLPDPASRFQPDGVHGLSQVVDPLAFRWECRHWRRPGWHGQTIYELHLGTFTPEGTFRAALEKLEHVAALGATAIELMPVADFPGRWNWGYDGVALYAPARCYGEPDDLRRLVDAAHRLGLSVILDVVYNHLGPDGNYLARYAADYFHPERHTPWGQAFNLAGPRSGPVRDWFVNNAAYWLDEFRIDGLRLDATHAIVDDSPRHLLAEIAAVAHARGAFAIAEDERNELELFEREGGGIGLDAAWADDFHHQIRVALTGTREGYFRSYAGTPAELAATLRQGWSFTGQPFPFWNGRPKGGPSEHLPPSAFVYCIENHDQVGNRARGERLEHLVSPAAFRAASALLCLSPCAPLLFMGQEWAASTPFRYFTDHGGELGRLVSEGRRKEFSAAGLGHEMAEDNVPDPQDETTFLQSKLAWDEVPRAPHASILQLYRACLNQRALWLHGAATERGRWRAAAAGDAVAIRYVGQGGQPDRLVVAALQGNTRLALETHDVLAAPAGHFWRLEIDSNATEIEFTAERGRTPGSLSGEAQPDTNTLVFDAPATVLLVAERTRAATPVSFAETARRIPVATYRLQLRKEFPLSAAAALVPYASALGISDFYASPVFLSTPGSTHGYDVNDYRLIDPELGGREALDALHRGLRERGMGLLLDFVPNHMGINGPGLLNTWWRDVLENGEHSRYAGFFDIDWNSSEEAGRTQVLVPILEDHYGRVLEQGKLSLVYERETLSVAYYDMRFPVRPATYASLLRQPDGDDAPGLATLAQAFASLPKADAQEDADSARARAGQLEDLKRQLAAAFDARPERAAALAALLGALNGRAGEPRSFDELDRIVSQQHYRLAFWKVGVHESNYRRFFAIDTLIGLRMEIPEVFRETHALLGELVQKQIVTGLRIDHIDGLRQPQQYLERLQTLAADADATVRTPLYVAVEKILAEGESLPEEWSAHGTTGYEFITQLADLLVSPAAESRFDRTYRQFCQETDDFATVVYRKKRLVLDEMFPNAVNTLANQLADLLQGDRLWRDLTRHELTTTLREVMAGLGVYRTYRRGLEPMTARDQRVVGQAAAFAVKRNPRLTPETIDLVRDVLTGTYPGEAGTPTYRRKLAAWVLSVQQYTGAVMAKAVEDTAFYTYSRFIGLNEVGGNPGRFGGTVGAFHSANAERFRCTPHGLLATATHDTKLGEDARARLYALSEIPHEWNDAVAEWREMNQRHKLIVEGRSAPDANEEYRLYQVLLATWPLEGEVDDVYRQRVRDHLRKALNEARRNTSWVHPHDRWLEAADHFVDAVLDPDRGRDFLAAFRPRAERVAHLGMVNSLTQVVLKLTVPGVPDFYQGTELWDLSLVDPDNRRPVDFARRQQIAGAEGASAWDRLLAGWRDGAVKWHTIRVLLAFRQENPELFRRGDYVPLELRGRFADNAVAFARRDRDRTCVVVVPRLTSRLGCPPLGLVWDDTAVVLPAAGAWHDVATSDSHATGATLPLSRALHRLPFAVLCDANNPGQSVL